MILEHGRKSVALKVVVYGPEGIGKSTFASMFPRPVFIDTEGSTAHMDVTRTPAPRSWVELQGQIRYFIDNPHELGTLILDTADWAEKLCIEHICAVKQIGGIEDLGYGKGYTYVKEEYGRLLNLLDQLKDRGVHVVMTAHAQLRKVEQPDEMGSYDRWEMKLSKQTFPLVKEWADMILFANYKTFIVNVDGKGAQKGKNKATGGARMMYASHHVCWDAKNRFGLPDEMPFDYGQISHIITDLQSALTPVSVPQAMPPALTPPAPAAPPVPAPIPTAPVQETTPAAPASDYALPSDIPPALAALMTVNKIQPFEVQAVAAQRGFFPSDMPISSYPEEFITGWCIGFWPQVEAAVLANRSAPTPF